MSTTPTQEQALTKTQTSPLVTNMALSWQMTPATMINTLKATIFPQKDSNNNQIVVSDAMLVAFLQVCHTYSLNPFVKEIYAFPSKGGGIVPMVPVDGWSKIINRHEQMDGLEFVDEWEIDSATGARKSVIPFSTTCIIYRKDRSHPTRVTEYFSECNQPTKEPWRKWPARMLRHKALIQCARIAFSLGGIFDPDEAERIAESDTDNGKQAITRPTRVVEGQVVAPAASTEVKIDPVKAEPKAESTPAAAPIDQQCICECCQSNVCDCSIAPEADRCQCALCRDNVEPPKTVTPAYTAQPTATELFGEKKSEPDPAPQPATGFINEQKIKKLIVVAKAAGMNVVKDSHDDQLHKLLMEKFGIDSVKKIPDSKFDAILKVVGGEKLNIK